MKESFNLIILIGQPEHDAFDILCKTTEHPWPAGPLCMHLLMSRIWADINESRGVELKLIQNTSFALVHRNATLLDTKKALVNYAGRSTSIKELSSSMST